MNGVDTYCFSNQMSSMTSKTVMFSMDLGDVPQESTDGNSLQYFLCIGDGVLRVYFL